MSKKIVLALMCFLIIMLISVGLYELIGDVVLVLPFVSFILLFVYLGTLKCSKCGALVLLTFKPLSFEVPILSVVFKHKCPNCDNDVG